MNAVLVRNLDSDALLVTYNCIRECLEFLDDESQFHSRIGARMSVAKELMGQLRHEIDDRMKRQDPSIV